MLWQCATRLTIASFCLTTTGKREYPVSTPTSHFKLLCDDDDDDDDDEAFFTVSLGCVDIALQRPLLMAGDVIA